MPTSVDIIINEILITNNALRDFEYVSVMLDVSILRFILDRILKNSLKRVTNKYESFEAFTPVLRGTYWEKTN